MMPLKTDPIDARRAAFRKLHGEGCFVIPNPWDVGSARYLQALGFQALATTSSGFAFSRGLPDAGSAVPRDVALSHFAEIVAGSGLPINADYQFGYAHEPESVFTNVQLCAQTGVAGLSIEDATGDSSRPLYELPLAVDRIRAARAALDECAPDVLLTARAECFLVGRPEPLKESIERLQAYAAAGADVLYAPGPSKAEDIKAIVAAAHPKPVNVLMLSNTGLRVSDLAKMGVRRISVGSALARAAWTGFIRAARAIAEEGSFEGLGGAISFAELNGFFRKDLEDRRAGPTHQKS
ncbi:MAG TPA: isocitrate lyase/phosphoenolpyruvate mutase family protein [Bryobacteraceae bacterium]|jgi:2-methylisocitrate lyase-like PEP mutase family enzyme|nr:isocitrate lyase/phosphoenolpyruvate mutase family protein [Bryobacteraceae bacterium]